MKPLLGLAPVNPTDAVRFQDVPNAATVLATMFRLASVIDGGAPATVYGNVYNLDFGVPTDSYSSTTQPLDCSAGRLTT